MNQSNRLSALCLGEAPVLRVEDVDQDVEQEKGLNIPKIITTSEPEFRSLSVPNVPLSKLR